MERMSETILRHYKAMLKSKIHGGAILESPIHTRALDIYGALTQIRDYIGSSNRLHDYEIYSITESQENFPIVCGEVK